jgi:hypothetical protein
MAIPIVVAERHTDHLFNKKYIKLNIRKYMYKQNK